MLELDRIRREITADPSNAWAASAGFEPVYVAHPEARCLIIGQAPGIRAQQSGIPWNDASGRRLVEWLGVDERTFRDPTAFAILPMDFYYPGKGATGDLPPRADFAPIWHPRLLELMPQIGLTLLVGDYAQRHYLDGKSSLTERVRSFRDFLPDRFPLVHPSPLNFRWQSRNPWFVSDVLPELRTRVAEALSGRP
ncbi:uracil DNA glycosylase family protein [Nocardioidaceae bacterium Broad-1]|uniref:uracil-DNA glycosylase family protein n=1 Tax=Nocardioides luteus TaxID=1844 RepID=UPI000202931C|nr:uracil-DNA glycosylase family protein [Nocardioides luteus]EGD45478.1 uracil DNA glycosylase family protein [Nocardioidaceae bacterium Broad-1]MBG6094159.1 uracil-DNA glycosylase [Nocardioides luteus]